MPVCEKEVEKFRGWRPGPTPIQVIARVLLLLLPLQQWLWWTWYLFVEATEYKLSFPFFYLFELWSVLFCFVTFLAVHLSLCCICYQGSGAASLCFKSDLNVWNPTSESYSKATHTLPLSVSLCLSLTCLKGTDSHMHFHIHSTSNHPEHSAL